MGLLDDVLGSAVPGGNLAKPVMIAAAALLGARGIGGGGLGKSLGGGAATSPTPPGAPAPASGQPAPGQAQVVCLVASAACSRAFNKAATATLSTRGSDPDRINPIAPDQLHQALGPQAVDNLSRLTGVAAPDLISELSRMLPAGDYRSSNAAGPHAKPGGDGSLVRWVARS
jgi:hypothetical protein